PAAIVGIAFCVTTLLQTITAIEKVRRLALAAAGLVVGAVVPMPALVLHSHDVYRAFHDQASAYAELTSPRLWEQAIRRAEWDIPYTRSELGVLYVLLALLGFGTAVRKPQLTSTLGGWLAFAAATVLLYARQSYQPFRNLLPLVPLAYI